MANRFRLNRNLRPTVQSGSKNKRMRHLAQRLTADLGLQRGQGEADIALPPRTSLSLLAEIAIDGIGIGETLVEVLALLWRRAVERRPIAVIAVT